MAPLQPDISSIVPSSPSILYHDSVEMSRLASYLVLGRLSATKQRRPSRRFCKVFDVRKGINPAAESTPKQTVELDEVLQCVGFCRTVQPISENEH